MSRVIAVLGAIVALLPGSSAAAVTIRTFPVPKTISAGKLQAALVDGPDGQEWVALARGSALTLAEVTPSGAFSRLPAQLAGDGVTGLISSRGFVWAFAHRGSLFAVSSTGSSAKALVSTVGAEDRDVVLGPDGELWAADQTGAIDRYAITRTPSASLSIYATGELVSPRAIASSAGRLWFTDDQGNLYSLTTSGRRTGPYADGLSASPHSLISAPNGSLWSATSSPAEIVRIARRTGQVAKRYGRSAGLAGGVRAIQALAAGPDGNIWFIESGAGRIGRLDIRSGKIANFAVPGAVLPALPSGYALASGARNTLWFTASTAAGQGAIGVISP